MKYSEERDAEAHKYTCKPQIPAFKEGADWTLTQSSVVRILFEALKCDETSHRLGGLDDCEPCKARRVYQSACAEIEGARSEA